MSNDSDGIDELVEMVGGDRKLAQLLGVIASVADENGVASMHDVTERFREVWLVELKREGRDFSRAANQRSSREVQAYLAANMVPALASQGVLELPSASLEDPDTVLRLSPEIWPRVSSLRSVALEHLLATGEHAVARSSVTRSSTPDLEPTSFHGESVLEAKSLVKIYRKRRVVNDVSVSVRQGEIVGLLGPNGAGKTTTFYMLVGLIAPQAGKVVLDGRDITDMPMYERARQGIGYLSQEPSIFRKLTVEQNILAILETLDLSSAERKSRLETLLNELGLARLRGSRAYQLSGGERRRLEITRALVTQPKFMMLDEPFAGVDPIAVHDIQTIVENLRTRGIGVLISDHNVEQTLDIVDRAYVMYDGHVKVSGTVRELVFDETVARDYLGPTLATRLRERFAEADEENLVS